MYIENLKSRPVGYFEQGRDLSRLHYLQNDGCWFFAVEHFSDAREFEAGIQVIDDLVRQDCFTSIKSLKLCQHAMQRFRNRLSNSGCPLTAYVVAKFIAEIDRASREAVEAIEPVRDAVDREAAVER